MMFLLMPHIFVIVRDIENDLDRRIQLARKSRDRFHAITLQMWIGRTAILVIGAFVFE